VRNLDIKIIRQLGKENNWRYVEMPFDTVMRQGDCTWWRMVEIHADTHGWAVLATRKNHYTSETDAREALARERVREIYDYRKDNSHKPFDSVEEYTLWSSMIVLGFIHP
jgi:hypothetical protein